MNYGVVMNRIKELQALNSDYKNANQVRNQARSLTLLSSGIYTEAERFVYELLQNAIDAFVDVDSDKLDIKINIKGDYFVFMHNGASFSDSDIEGLCSVGNGNKTRNANKVGYKGIGFKAVFMQSSQVYVQSGQKCCFKFDREACYDLLSEDLKTNLVGINGPLYDDVPWQIIPIEAQPPLALDSDGYNVVIYVKMPRLAELLPRIDKMLKDREFLLFLKADQVAVSLYDHDRLKTSISRSKKGERVELAVNGLVVSRWMMHAESVRVTQEVKAYIAQNISSVPEKLREADQIEVTFSVKIGESGEFVPLQNSVVYTYLPTSYGNLGIPYLINANFITDAGRQQLQNDSEWNKLIFRESPRLFLKWVSTISHSHPDYYKILPQRSAKIYDDLSSVFFSSLSMAIQRIAFLPSRVNEKVILAEDAYVDRVGFSDVLGREKFAESTRSLFGHEYNADCEIDDVDSLILSSYGVRILGSRDVLTMLMDGHVLADIGVDEDFKLISFLQEKITSPDELEDLKPIAFLLDEENKMSVAHDLCLPSDFKGQQALAKDVRTLNEDLFNKLNGTVELQWLRTNFGLKEMSDFGFVKYILSHPDYITVDNAVSVGRFFFQMWKNENFFLTVGDINEELKCLKFLTNKGHLKPITNLHLGSRYLPRHDLEDVAPDLDMFVSSKYLEGGDNVSDWSFFLRKCGASDAVGISQRVLDAEPIDSNGNAVEELKHYPMLEDAAAAFRSRKHPKKGYWHHENPIEQKQIEVSYFSYIDPAGPINGELERYVLNIALSQALQSEIIKDLISGKVHYWGNSIVDSLFDHVPSNYSNKYNSFLAYAIAEKQLFPTTSGIWLPAKEVLINSSEIARLAGPYLPVLDISNSVHYSWRAVIPFREKLTLDDYLRLLAEISNDAGNAKNNKERISLIYETMIAAGYTKDESIRKWGETHRILSRNGEYIAPSDLSYILVAGFKGAQQAYDKVDRHYQSQLIDLFRTFGVRIVDKVSPEFVGVEDSDGLKEKLACKVAYLALLGNRHAKSDFEEYVDGIAKKIDDSEFYHCERIDLSYGDRLDKISRTIYSEGNRFYYVGELGPGKMELLSSPLCKYLGLGDKDRELLVVLISTTGELNEYFREKGYPEDLLHKAIQMQENQTASQRDNQSPQAKCLVDFAAANDEAVVVPGIDQDCVQERAGHGPDENPELTREIDRKHKAGEYDVCDDEYIQLSALFEGGLAGENSDDQTKKWQDESKLACLRLFNYLKEQGLDPTMDGRQDADYIITTLYADMEDEEVAPANHRGPNIEINTGKCIHVISARGGVAYLSPTWWNRVSALDNNRFEVCAITGAKIEEMIFLRTRDDVLSRILDNALPVKIRGKNEQERYAIVSDWFAKINIDATAAKIYALLKVKSSTNMNKAFEKGFCSDDMSEQERDSNVDLWG